MHCQNKWKDELADLLNDWKLLFIKGEGPAFPSNFAKFEELVQEAGRHCNVRKIRPGRWWKTIVRVDSQYPKLCLVGRLDQLVYNLMKTPCEPGYAVWLASQREKGWQARPLADAIALLRRFPFQKIPDGVNWAEIFCVLRGFTSPGFQQILAKPAEERELDYNEKLQPLMRFLGWAALLDIDYHTEYWWMKFHGAHQFAQSICHLNNPDYSQRLVTVFPALLVYDYQGAEENRRSPGFRKSLYRRRMKLKARGFLVR
jgi:hypothetical protein